MLGPGCLDAGYEWQQRRRGYVPVISRATNKAASDWGDRMAMGGVTPYWAASLPAQKSSLDSTVSLDGMKSRLVFIRSYCDPVITLFSRPFLNR